MDLMKIRRQLRMSQSKLSRQSGVSRFRICLFELGERPLRVEEQQKIEKALRQEALELASVNATLTT